MMVNSRNITDISIDIFEIFVLGFSGGESGWDREEKDKRLRDEERGEMSIWVPHEIYF